MLGPIATPEAIDPVLFAKDLGDVGGDRIDDGLDARLVQPVGVGPFRDRMRIQQSIGTDFLLVALHVILDSI